MTRVLSVITSTARRGAEVFALDLADHLIAHGRSIRTVALAAGAHPGGLPVPVLGNRTLAPATVRALRKEATSARVVIAHGSDAVIATALATLGTGVPFVYRNIGDVPYWITSPTKRAMMRFIVRRASAVVALWSSSAASLRALGAATDKINIIPNAVPAERFRPIDEKVKDAARRRLGLKDDHPVALYIGSLSPEKNVSLAIDVISAISDAILLVVGDGPDRDELRDHARRKAPGRVEFLGSTQDPHSILAAADVLLLPSRTEGIPAVLIEAAFSMVPIVATDVGGVSEIVGEEHRGLVPPGDEQAMIAAVRSSFLGGRGSVDALRSRCMSRFEIREVGIAWDDLLARLGAWENRATDRPSRAHEGASGAQ